MFKGDSQGKFFHFICNGLTQFLCDPRYFNKDFIFYEYFIYFTDGVIM